MKHKKIVFIILILFFISILGYHSYQHFKFNSWDWISSDNALEDLEECLEIVQNNHPACYKGLPSEMEEIYNELKQKYSNHSLISRYEEYLDLSRLISSLHDGHTRIGVSGNVNEYMELLDYEYIPDIKFDYTNGKIYLYNENGKFEVIKINNTSWEEIIERCSMYYPTENEYGIKSTIQQLAYHSKLVNLDIAKSTDKKVTISFYEGNTLKKESYSFQQLDKEKNKKQIQPWDSEFNPEEDYAVLTINQCIRSEEFQSYLDNFFHEVCIQNIGHVAIDVRKNLGGNSIYSLFFEYLPGKEYIVPHNYFIKPPENTGEWTIEYDEKSDHIFAGELYVLTSVNTFSSAKEVPNVLSINNLATVIGEPSSNAPNSYGECGIIELSSGNFKIQFSTSYVFLSSSLKDYAEVDILCPSDNAYEKFKEIIHPGISIESGMQSGPAELLSI